MTATTPTTSRAFAVWFKDLGRWDASSFQRIKWSWPEKVMVPIGSVLNLRKDRVDRKRFKFSDLQPITIHFDGSVEKRVVDSNREYSMDLWFARPGDIVVAKIDLKNGAVAIVPSDWPNVVVTGHFAVYEPNRSRLLPEYLLRIIQTNFFKAHLWRNKVGAEGRKEVKLDFFEKELIPLPALAEQEAIVACWRKAQRDIAAAKQRITEIQSSLHQNTHRLLGMAVSNNYILPRALAIEWKSLERWSVEFLGRQMIGLNKNKAGAYLTFPLGVLCNGISGGTPSKRRSDFWNGNIPWISPKDMKSAHIYDSQDHITQIAVDKGVSLVPKNSVLLVVRSGILQHTVPVAVNKVDTAINQDIRAFVPKNSHQILSDYLADLLSAQQESLLRLVKWSTTVQSINKEELDRFPVHLPPLPIQREIVAVVAAGRKEIARERTVADCLARDINAEVEALILGTKKIREL